MTAFEAFAIYGSVFLLAIFIMAGLVISIHKEDDNDDDDWNPPSFS